MKLAETTIYEQISHQKISFGILNPGKTNSRKSAIMGFFLVFHTLVKSYIVSETHDCHTILNQNKSALADRKFRNQSRAQIS